MRRIAVPLAAAAVLSALAAPGAAHAQSVDELIRTLGEANARAYARPIGSGLGAAMNRGWFATARPAGPFDVTVGVRMMAGIVPPEDDSFEPVLPATIAVPELGGSFDDPYGTGAGVVTPTATGAGAGARLPPQGDFRQAILDRGLDPADFALTFPRGLDLPAVPIAVLQGGVGLPAGTQVTARWLPGIEVDSDLGTLRSVGAGFLHSLTQWVPVGLPVDVAVGGGLQRFEVGDYLTADSRHATLVVSRTLADLTLFVSGTVENTEFRVDYTLENPRLPEAGTTISFEDEAADRNSLTAGFRLDLLFLQLDASYSLSRYDALRAGFGFTF